MRKKGTMSIKIKIAFMVMSIAAICDGMILDKFEDPAQYWLKSNNAELSRSNSSMLLSWKDPVRKSMSIIWKKNLMLPNDFRDGKILLTIRPDKPALLKSITLRLADSKGEIFRFLPAKIYITSNGRQVFDFLINRLSWTNSWGRNVDKKIDWPVHISDISCVVNANGSMILEKMELRESSASSIKYLRPFFHFNPENDIVRPEQYKLKLTQQKLELKGGRKKVMIQPVCWERELFSKPEKVILNLIVKSGKGSVALTFQDRKGNRYKVKADRKWKPGTESLEFDFSKIEPEKMIRTAIVIIPDTKTFEMDLIGGQEFMRETAVKALDFDVDTGNPLHILEPDQTDKFRLVFYNPTKESLDLKASVNFCDFSGESFTEKFPLKMKPGETLKKNLSQKLKRLGIWYVNCKITDVHGKYTDFRQKSFALMYPGKTSPLPDKDDFLFGMNCHMPHWPKCKQDLALKALTSANVKLVRCIYYWSEIQPKLDKWDFTNTDKLVETLQEYGIAHHWTLNPTPRWAAPPEVRNSGYWVYSRTAPMPGLYGKFAGKLAQRYKGKVRIWELWNEADINQHFTFKDYLRLLKEGYTAIRKADPDALIGTTGFTSMTHPRLISKDFQEKVLTEGKGFYDLHIYHRHGGFQAFTTSLDKLMLPMRKRAKVSKPWIAGETAVTSAGFRERMQAITVFKKIIFAWSRGAIGYNWHQLRCKAYDPFNSEHNYGLMTPDFYPKAGYVVYAALAKEYAKAKYLERKDLPQSKIFMFQAPGRYLIAAWNDTGQAPTNTLCFETDARVAEQLDIMGNRKKLNICDGIVMFEVSGVPSTLVLNGALRAELKPSLVQVEPCLVMPGKKTKCNITLFNPLSKTIKIDLQFSSAVAHISPKRKSINLRPEEKRVELFDIQLPVGFNKEKDKTASITLKFTVDKLNFNGSINIPLLAPIVIPAVNTLKRKADYILDNASQAFNRYQADPASVHRVWSGPDDLSARVWLNVEDQKLLIYAEVTDDIHRNNEKDRKIYRGDSMQVGFTFPGNPHFWEIGFARMDDGKNYIHIWNASPGFSKNNVKGISFTSSRKGHTTIYDAAIPLSLFECKSLSLKKGFSFNILFNEDDGYGYDGWIALEPGLGGAKNLEHFRKVILE